MEPAISTLELPSRFQSRDPQRQRSHIALLMPKEQAWRWSIYLSSALIAENAHFTSIQVSETTDYKATNMSLNKYNNHILRCRGFRIECLSICN